MDFDSLSPEVKQVLVEALCHSCGVYHAIDRGKWTAATKLADDASMKLAAAAKLQLQLVNVPA